MRYIELFAGIGGFRNGLERVDNVKRIEIAQQTDVTPVRISNHPALLVQERRQSAFTCVYANEWDKYAASIYRRHYGEIDTRDITTVDVRDIPDHDLLTAGFPCQDFSIAGKRAGLDGTRGTLFYEIARILKSKRPRHFLLENVKGLLSHKEGETFQTILGVLSDLGYRAEWMVLNSKHFGVPQNRERVFIVGHLRGQCTGEVFPISGNDWENNEMVELPESSVSPTLTKRGAGELHSGMILVKTPRIRRLTPVECARLQGFPDNWVEYGMMEDGTIVKISDTQQYKCYGNAVTTKVITAIGMGLFTHLKKEQYNDRL